MWKVVNHLHLSLLVKKTSPEYRCRANSTINAINYADYWRKRTASCAEVGAKASHVSKVVVMLLSESVLLQNNVNSINVQQYLFEGGEVRSLWEEWYHVCYKRIWSQAAVLQCLYITSHANWVVNVPQLAAGPQKCVVKKYWRNSGVRTCANARPMKDMCRNSKCWKETYTIW